MVRLHLLGRPTLVGTDGDALAAVEAQPKRLAILAYLATESRNAPVPRDRLLGLFWPEHDAKRASTNLRKSLFFLRKHLGRRVLVSVGRRLSVDPERLVCDVARVRTTWFADPTSDSGAVFLEDFFYSGASREWEDWVDAVRIALSATGRSPIGDREQEHRLQPDQLGIAVLPFKSAPDRRIIADGLSLELGDRLRDHGFRVLAPLGQERVTVGASALPQLRESGIDLVVQGSFEETGPAVSVSVVVSETDSLTQVWGEQYQATTDSLTGLAETVSLAMCSRLRGSTGRDAAPRQAPTADFGAYADYLRARAREWGSTENMLAAIRFYQSATRRDPSFAEAFARLANLYCVLPLMSGAADGRAFAQAREAANTALRLDPFSPLAHCALADVQAVRWCWKEARHHYEAAVRMGPTYPRPRAMYSAFLLSQGDYVGAVDQAALLTRLDSGSPEAHISHGFALFYQGEYERALQALGRALELAPSHAWALMERAWNQSMLERHDDAARDARVALAAIDGRDHWGLATMAWVLARAGALTEAQELFGVLNAAADQGAVDALSMALVNLALGERAAAVGWVEEAAATKAPQAWLIRPMTRRFLGPIEHEPSVAAARELILSGGPETQSAT